MAVDLDQLDEQERTRYQQIGNDFTTEQVQQQGGKTRAAFVVHGAKLASHGYVKEDDELLGELLGMGEQRPTEQAEADQQRRSLTGSQQDRMRKAKTVRQKLRSLVHSSANRVALTGAHKEEVAAARTAHSTTSSAGADAITLATQLDVLVAVLKAGPIGAEAANRGAAPVIAQAAQLAADLREGVRGAGARSVTSHDAARFALIEGLSIELMRAARAAARAASRELGDPKIAQDFELDKLYAQG